VKGDRALVPDADFRSYYGRAILKPPVWKQPDVPLYLFLGGVAGASSVLAEGAAAADLPALRRVARLSAATGAGLGTVALIHDLGRPERFLNMLRVFKPTSPLSVGSWILSPFATFASAAAASEVTGIAPRLGRLAGVGAAVFGPPLTTYTAALLCNTAVPSWHEAHREMPFLFAGSGSAAAGGLAMTLVPLDQAGPARRLAAVGAALELGVSELMEHNLGSLLSEPYKTGKSGRLLRAAKMMTVAGGLGAAVSGRSRVLSGLAGLALMGGSILTRFGVYEAGMVSARDPKYTVIPQRERVDARAAAAQTAAPEVSVAG
jgi:hypothetical protein